ncbi:MAG: hypothetical protein PHT13_13950 [Methanosarcina sp.]|nr:hypothetical protein [Methanosarcina sp.]
MLQADGHLDLETNRNMGDEMDLYKETASTAISHSTVPSSNLWDGSESGLIISNISAPGQIITFKTGIQESIEESIEEKEIKHVEFIKIIKEAQVKIDEELEKLRAIA